MPRPGEQRFLNGQGLITQWPTKRADKLLVLSYLVSKFKFGQIYTEAQVNEILKIWHSFSDWPLLRRELVEQGYLSRNRDGSDYRRTEISTNLSGLTLVKPEVERDAAAGVKWLAGPTGRETLRLMGVTEDQNHPTTLDTERNRVRDFISSTYQLTWMIRFKGRIVGAVWVNLAATKYLPAPSIHIMIGDRSVRGQGIGEHVIRAVISELKALGNFDRLHSRHLIDNIGSAKLLAKVGFQTSGAPYADADGLNWQNVEFELARTSVPHLTAFFKFPKVTLSIMQDKDIAPTVALINQAYSYLEAYTGEPRTSPARLNKRMRESEFYVAKQKDDVVGCLYVERENEAVHFGLLAVVEKLRGTGLAPALIKAVEAYARALGAHRVELDYMSISPWLKPYYEKFGYRETGQIINWGTIDLIQMAKRLKD